MINATFSVVEAAIVLLPVLAIAIAAVLTGTEVAARIEREQRARALRRAMVPEPRAMQRVEPRPVAIATGRKGGEREDDGRS
jgi:hypothetical protein